MSHSVLSMLVFLGVFAVIYAVGLVVYLRAYGERRRAIDRLRSIADDGPDPAGKPGLGETMQAALPKFGALLFPDKEKGQDALKKKLLFAGLYRPNAHGVFLGVKMALMLVLPLFVVVPYLLGDLAPFKALVLGMSATTAGMIAPGLWLDMHVRKRQQMLRQALPDALDMLVLCLEGGASMASAFQRVTSEVQVVHPLLGYEMNIMQREIQLGLSSGDAWKKMGERCGLDDVRDLASVLLQSERFGASIVKALRTYAETWRMERQQRAEESAQKAAVKILFPTLLCIFPAIFIVLLGPAAFQMAALFGK
jgi:tight adherence protein C